LLFLSFYPQEHFQKKEEKNRKKKKKESPFSGDWMDWMQGFLLKKYYPTSSREMIGERKNVNNQE